LFEGSFSWTPEVTTRVQNLQVRSMFFPKEDNILIDLESEESSAGKKSQIVSDAPAQVASASMKTQSLVPSPPLHP
jgi:hypothetical protein